VHDTSEALTTAQTNFMEALAQQEYESEANAMGDGDAIAAFVDAQLTLASLDDRSRFAVSDAIVSGARQILFAKGFPDACSSGNASLTSAVLGVANASSASLADGMRSCALNNTRATGVDMAGSVISDVVEPNEKACQKTCSQNSACKYFLYFTQQHYDYTKRRYEYSRVMSHFCVNSESL
jgi:hypothetical protein